MLKCFGQKPQEFYSNEVIASQTGKSSSIKMVYSKFSKTALNYMYIYEKIYVSILS